MNVVLIDGVKARISHHAVCRYAERFGADEESMRAQLTRAVVFGAQRGKDRVYLDEDTAFILDSFGVVKTVLSRAMLFANMQVSFRNLTSCQPLKVSTNVVVDLEFLESLAARHCSSCFPHGWGKRSRKTRNRELREYGIAPQSEHEKMYHEFFLKAYQERIAEESVNGHSHSNRCSENGFESPVAANT